MIDIQSIIDEQSEDIEGEDYCDENMEEIEISEVCEMTKNVEDIAAQKNGVKNASDENDTNSEKSKFQIVENPYYDIGLEDENKVKPCTEIIPDLNDIEIITTTENIYYKDDN